MVGAVVAFGSMISLGMASFLGPVGFLVMVVMALIVGPLAVNALSGTKKAFAGDAVLEDGVLRIRDLDLAVKKDEIRQGMETGADGRVLLDLVDSELLRVDFGPDAAMGERFLAALGVGAEQRTMRVPLRGQLGWFMMGVSTFVVGLLPAAYVAASIVNALATPGEHQAAILWLMVALAALLAVAVVRRFGKPHVIVGADGIRLRGMVLQPFIPYARIKRVRLNGWYVVLELADGKPLELPLIAVDPTRLQSFTNRIQQGIRRASGVQGPIVDSLSRSGRPLDEWKTALLGLTKREASFREAPIDPEEVARIATDPAADADQRVAAAFMLRELDPEAPARIRIAAESTADEELRAALLEAAEGELESDAVERVARREIKTR